MPAIAFIALVILCLLSLIQFLMNPTEWTKFFLSILPLSLVGALIGVLINRRD